MRYDTPIYFQRVLSGEYNPATGNYDDDSVTETQQWVNKTDSGVETLNFVYGAIKQGVYTLRMQRPYTEPFDCIRIGSKKYRVDFSRSGKTFVVSEVK